VIATTISLHWYKISYHTWRSVAGRRLDPDDTKRPLCRRPRDAMPIPDVIDSLRDEPERLADISAREFEGLTAELLASKGWDVSVTAATRDGGVDVIGISRDATGFETSWAVECKHYRIDRPVGVAVVRQLYAVQQALRFTQALLVVSSRLTPDAAAFTESVGMHVADAAVIARWISEYPSVSPVPRLISRRFLSCFVSHSSRDEPFVSKLVARLRSSGVRVWYAPDDLLAGQKLHEEIQLAIKQFDRLILVLSQDSMLSPWVQTEIREARRREIVDQARVLFPISLVPYDGLRAWELFDTDSGQDLAVEIREYFIPDFSDWEDEESFAAGVKALLQALRVTNSTG
jgi:hypothetical protein